MRRLQLLSLCLLITFATGCANVSKNNSGGGGGGGSNIAVAITNKFSSTGVGGPGVTVDAAVTGDHAGLGVTWALTGNNCSAATCGTLTAGPAPSFSAAYVPPTSVPAAATSLTITATSVSDGSKKDSFTFTVSTSSGTFAGSYTLLARGYDSAGSPMAIATSFVVDGKGTVTGGEMDINDAGTITSSASLTGTYTFDNSFSGITRGTISLNPVNTEPVAFKYVLSNDGTRGTVIEFDTINALNSGEILQQDPAALSGSAAGNYAFATDSDAPLGKRAVQAGNFALTSSGITGGNLDQSQAAAASSTSLAFGASAATAPDALGRGKLEIDTGNGIQTYAYYVARGGRLNLIQIDAGGPTVFAGQAHTQKTLSANDVTGASVIQMTGLDKSASVGVQQNAALIGVMSFSGANVAITFDANDAGTVVTSRPVNGSITSFDAASGRGVIAVTSGYQAEFLDSLVFYLYDTGRGYIIDGDPTGHDPNAPATIIVNKAYSGTLTPQAAGPFDLSSIAGNMLAESGASATSAIPNITGVFTVSSSDGSFSATAELTSLPAEVGQISNKMFGGALQVSDNTLGHGNATLPAGFYGEFSSNQPQPATFYVIAPNEFVMIGTLSGTATGVSFFSPQ